MSAVLRRYRFELILGAILVLLCAVFWHWEAPGTRLSSAETDTYLSAVGKQLPMTASEKADLISRLRKFAQSDDGKPIYLLNLMRFYPSFRQAGGVSFHGTPAEANTFYERHVVPLVIKNGEFPLFGGTVAGDNISGSLPDEGRWSRIALMRSPSRRAFLKLLADPDYAKYAPLKMGALHLALVPVEGETSLPDMRLFAIFAALIIFLGTGWMRAARRAAGPNIRAEK